MTAAAAPGRLPRKRRAGFWFSFLPSFSWLTFFYFVPLAVLLSYSVAHHDYVNIVREFTLENFREMWTNPGYRNTLGRTLYIASLVTVIDLLLAFPVAYFLSFYAGRWKGVLTVL